jgi:uncharacterized protein
MKTKKLPDSPNVQAAEIAVRADGSLRLAVVSDTHSAPHLEALRLIAAQKPDAILHGGDIGDLGVLDTLKAIAPLFAVRGNIDVHAPEVPSALTLDLIEEGASALRILLIHIAVYGPKLRADAVRLATEHRAALIVCGHSHVPFIGRDRGLSMFNPGSIGPRRFGLPLVFGMFELRDRKVRMHHVDVETGQRWLPASPD